jgi:hypothetical protein
LISTAFHQRPLLDQNDGYHKHCAVLQREWEGFAKKKSRNGKEIVQEIHISETFVPVLYVLVTSMKLHVCQAKAYCGGMKYFQARHIIILPLHNHMLQ